MDNTDTLIAQLAGNLTPVKRLRGPLRRAGLWLLTVGLIAAVFVAMRSNLGVFLSRAADPKLALELAGTFLTGILAVIASFQLSLPDRSPRWILAPIPPLLLWLGSSGYSCWRHWMVYGSDGWTVGESASCFAWIVGVSVPLGLGLFFVVRRAQPLEPVAPAAMGALGVAGIAAFVLQFFHPFDVTVMDLGLHVAAVALVVAVATTFSRVRA